MRTRFHQQLDELKEKLLVMAGFAEQAVQRAIEAYRTRDGEFVDLVRRSEPAINRLEREIDSTALDLLAMEQPMAVDLRFILSVIRINADLERVGDLAVNIALRAGETNVLQPVDLHVLVGRQVIAGAPAGQRATDDHVQAVAGHGHASQLHTAVAVFPEHA